MSMLTLSGWTQPVDAVKAALALDAATFEYSYYASREASYEGLRAYADAEHVVGWSMGGLIAIQAIADGVLKPKRLTLIATPYQFVSGEGFSGGMDPTVFQQFRDSYARDAMRTMQRFAALMGKGDREATRVASGLRHHSHVTDTARWLPWLDALGAASLRGMDLSMLPPTHIVHGAADAITPLAQAEALAALLPHATADHWDEAGHAPHLHDAERLRKVIA